MPESQAHKLLKLRAVRELIRRGFKRKEISEEYKLHISKYHWYFVDVVGLSVNEKIAYECGITTIKTLKEELLYFDKVIWIPYLPKYSHNWLHRIYGDACLKHRVSPVPNATEEKEAEVRRFLEGDNK